jgi:sterol desaturase/sphingolipid hydroxylase (fatty acid hydroxylase superfamily)
MGIFEKIAHGLVSAEIPEEINDFSLRFKWFFHLFVMGALIAAAVISHWLFIGINENEFREFLEKAKTSIWFKIYIAAFFFALVSRLIIVVLGYFRHKKVFGQDVSPRYVMFMVSSFILFNVMFLLLVLLVDHLVAFATTGISLKEGQSFFEFIRENLNSFNDSVPTLVELPYWLAFPLVWICTSFFGYWGHRLPHESRFLWLLSHRPHHTSTTLTYATVMEADPKFVLGFAISMIFAFASGTVAKLVYHEPLYYEFLFIAWLHATTEAFNHNSSYYEDMMRWWKRYKWLHGIFYFIGSGPYHYMHHSCRPGDEVINIGGGPFMLWDHVFGTYKKPTDKKPAVGLTNQPEIYLSPAAHVFSGLFQIIYELWNNLSPRLWLQILFGGVYYMPPKSKSFLKKPKTEQPEGPSLPHIWNESVEPLLLATSSKTQS